MKSIWVESISWRQFLLVLTSLLLIGGFLRLYQLESIPAGLTWDEAAIGYNGFAIWSTFRDEWLRRIPLSFQSFGDFKAPAAIYINGFFTMLLGPTVFAVRVPFALAGTVAIAAMAWLVLELVQAFTLSSSKKEKPIQKTRAQIWSLLSAGLLTLSPWHIHFSRAGFESGLALTSIVLGSAAAFRWKNHSLQWWWGGLAVTAFVFSLYAYHSSKVFIPLLAICLIYMCWHEIKKNIKQTVLLGLYGLAISVPLAYSILFKSGAARAQQTSLLAAEGSLLEKIWMFVTNLATHVSPGFLVLGQTTTLRHGDGAWGVLFSTTCFLVILSLGWLAFTRKTTTAPFLKKMAVFGLVWVILGLVPAALGFEVPHSNRALLALPGFILLALVGLEVGMEFLATSSLNKQVRGSHDEKNILPKLFLGNIILVHGLLFFAYWNHYLTEYKPTSTEAFIDGYVEAVDVAAKYQDQVNHVVFSDKYGQPYIYVLFRNKIDPFQYRHHGALHKYLFKGVESSDLLKLNTLVVATPEDSIDHSQADEVVSGADGSARFYIYYPKP